MQTADLFLSPLAVIRRLAAGWSTPEAVFAIVDNAVQAGARNVWVHLCKENDAYNDRRKNNIAAYEVVDDGCGMDEAGMAAALSLAANGAPDDHSLSKFGLGLKAAAQSQGDELHLISSPGDGAPFRKLVVAFDAVTPNRYFATAHPLTEADEALVAGHLPDGRGTIVRIARVRKGGHPSVKDTVQTLRERAGVIYFYFLRDSLTLTIRDEPVEPFDPLVTAEADAHGTLDEHEWDGKSVRWIQKPITVTLDVEQNVTATVEATQLPYPPIFDLDEPGQRKATQDRYRIEAGNYGYYVYRNGRLISWAEQFGRMIPQHGDLYGFRGRLLIDESADEAFNIDLKKSHLMLSDEAWATLSDLSDAYKSKSRKAWKHAGALKKKREGEEPNKVANELAAEFDPPVLADEATATPEEATEQAQREQEAEESDKARMRRETARAKQAETGEDVTEADVSDEEVTEVARGPANPAASRIFRVDRVEDNALWEPYYDSEHGWSVRINAPHRFGRLVFERNSDNTDLQVLFELLLLTMAQAEVQTQKVSKLSRTEAERLLGGYRRSVSEYLAKLCLDLGDRLPPLDE